MPALFIYLIKVNVALLIFCLGYYAVLRHLTFYTLNRIYLVTAIVFSTLYPKVDLKDFLTRHEQMQSVVINWQEPVKAMAQSTVYDVWYWMQLVFWVGVCLFGIRLLTQLLSLYRLHKQSEPAQIRHYMIRVIHGNINPFSFWRSIYLNPANHSPNELDAILEHEQIHVNQWHTLDILLSEISAIFYWFNPGIWLMKRAIRENIEFITDRKILQKGVDSKAYQYSLLNVNFGAQSNAVVNHFNISTIKKRIIMMNAKKSSSVNITRYVFLIPVVMVLLLVFSVSKAELSKGVTKSSASVMRVLQAAATKISFTVQQKTNTVSRRPATVLTAVSSFIIQHDTLPKTGKALALDTNKSFKLIIREMNNSGTEPDIYIDGVKTSAGLGAIDPNKISSIDIIKNAASSPNGAIYVVTKGHTATTTVYTTTFSFDADSAKKSKNKLTEVIVKGYASKPVTNVRVNGLSYHTNSDVNKVVINGDTVYKVNGLLTKTNSAGNTPAIETLTLHRDSSASGAVTNVIVRATNGMALGGGGKVTYHAMSAGPSPISFADKLIVIDGKEASAKEMKKLSADKIESVNNLLPYIATAKYGDKAKNGAIIITTKK